MAKKTRPVKSTAEKEGLQENVEERGLRISWIRFIDAYIENNGNGTEAYKVVFPDVKNDKVAQVNAAKLLSKSMVREELNNKLSAQQATEEYIVNRLIGLTELHFDGKGAFVSVKALEILAKMKGLLVDTKKIAFTGDNPAIFASPYSATEKAEMDKQFQPAEGKVLVRVIE